MKKIEFIEEVEENGTLRISEQTLIKRIKVEGLANIIKEYDIPEDFIIKNHLIIDKEIILKNMVLSENFILNSIDIGFIEESDISDLNMVTYSKLSSTFLKAYKKHINWERMVLYLSSSELLDVEKYVDIIEQYNLWYLISANDLPIEFIRENKSKLNWNILSLVKCFNEDELVEFSEFIPEKREFDYSQMDISSISTIRECIKKEFESFRG